MDLKEEFEHPAKVGLAWIEYHLDGLGVRTVIAISGVLNVSARVSHASRNYAWLPSEEIFHSPKAPPCQNRLLGLLRLILANRLGLRIRYHGWLACRLGACPGGKDI
jgi:hypothetical protein